MPAPSHALSRHALAPSRPPFYPVYLPIHHPPSHRPLGAGLRTCLHTGESARLQGQPRRTKFLTLRSLLHTSRPRHPDPHLGLNPVSLVRTAGPTAKGQPARTARALSGPSFACLPAAYHITTSVLALQALVPWRNKAKSRKFFSRAPSPRLYKTVSREHFDRNRSSVAARVDFHCHKVPADSRPVAPLPPPPLPPFRLSPKPLRAPSTAASDRTGHTASGRPRYPSTNSATILPALRVARPPNVRSPPSIVQGLHTPVQPSRPGATVYT